MKNIHGKKVAILTEDGFEEVELTGPRKALQDAGAIVHVISTGKDRVKAWNHDHWSMEIVVDLCLDDARAEDYDALLLPGGVMNPDKLRMNREAVAFADQFFENGKPVAAICHGPQLLIETGRLEGLHVTSFPSLQTDLENAGAIWEDKEVVMDGGLITSRNPEDLPAFNKKIIAALQNEGKNGWALTGDQPLIFKYSQSM